MNSVLALAALVLSATVVAQDSGVSPDPTAGDSPLPAPRVSPPGIQEPANATPATQKPAEAKPLASREAAEILSEQELAHVVDLLRNNYIHPDGLSELGLARATLQGLLDRFGAGARIYSKITPTPQSQSPLRSEWLGNVGYLRVGSLNELGALDSALEQFAAKPATALVLDLRATPHSTDFELAAEVCQRFAPKGRILFTIKRPKVNDEEILTSRDDPRWRGLLVVLVDSDTAGAAEVIAAVLRTHLRAYIIGQQTKGEAAQFEDLPLPSGKILRVAVGEVSLPDATPVFPGGLRPDLPLAVTQEKTDELLVAALAEGVESLVMEKERARMNEAALVAGLNPELDAAQERQKMKERGEAPKAPARDEAVQRALDYITTVKIFEAGRAKRR